MVLKFKYEFFEHFLLLIIILYLHKFYQNQLI